MPQYIDNNGLVYILETLKSEGAETLANAKEYTESVVANYVLTENLEAAVANLGYLTASKADIRYATIDRTDIIEASVEQISGDFLAFKTGEFESLKADQASFETATAENFTAVRADINNLTVGNFDAKYAKIDFANIDTANIRQGFMENLMVSQGIFTSDITAAEGTFTNYITGVNILANNINAGTLSVERLIITGSDQSIVYEINKANGTLQMSQTTVDGGSLTERTISADRIVAGSITGNEIAATTITGQHIVANSITADKLEANTITAESACIHSLNANKITTGTLSADRMDVNGLFAKNITATGTITGAKLVGATGSFTGSINATSGVFSCGNDYGQTVDIRDGRIWMNDVETQIILDGNGLRVQSKGGHNYAYIAQDGIYTETELTAGGNVTCTDVKANGWAYVGQLRFKQNSSGNYISIGNYNNAWNNYYYAPGYHAFYCNGNGVAYIQSDGLKLGNYDLQFNLNHGVKYGSGEWILRPYTSGDYNVTALGNGNRRTVLYGSQVRLNGANGTTVSSDRRLKKDFASFDERYEKFFMNLKPVTYRMAYEQKSEEYKRTNGFIAQDVEQALKDANINSEGLDLISYDTADQEFLSEMFNGHPPDIKKQYSLNYNNFISLNTYMIQKNRKYLNYQVGRIDMQEAIINELQSRLWQAEKEIKQLKQTV